MTDAYPTVSAGDVWREADRSQSVLADPGPTRVLGHTRLFEPVDDAGVEGTSRFAFCTALSFDVQPPPGVASTLRPVVVSAAEGAFAERLRERGLASVDRGRRERLRTDAGRRARLRRFTAEFLPDGDSRPVPVEGWLAVWSDEGRFRVAGGAYPCSDPRGDGSVARGRYREELLAFVRGVE